MMHEATNEKALIHLWMLAGQLGRVVRIVEKARSSVDALAKVASARVALGEVGEFVLHCYADNSMSAARICTEATETAASTEPACEMTVGDDSPHRVTDVESRVHLHNPLALRSPLATVFAALGIT